MSQVTKIKELLKSIKLDVEDINAFEKDINSIMEMFNHIKEAGVNDTDTNLHKKKISLNNLRKDFPINSGFRKEMYGKYFKVPTVSKKEI